MANTPQAKNALLMSFKSQLSSDVRSMLVNFEEILKMACRDRNGQIQETTQYEIDALEMQLRAANVVRAADSLMKLVNDLKEYHILYDFPGIDEEIKKNCELIQAKTLEYDEKIGKLAQDMADELVALEEEFYEYGSRNLD
ncbi:mediator of RNA polymerase II transcription subunit 22 [Drosophila subpulchrella]|uniref:mediator of RNA polymerase II transcription subunit 22 n=1 Tax=Drosophila subpulchrella TaxID=1486046 RepID=UPI0018A14A46|nr:mediator of RNA polymerase II transcription subunit 22 [Drosophila subpulchrella]XP_037708574.1 mediator of RNA polymerase II transcription subunit 22 [Drosophila subpulchrella]XP_037708575.1 mediator of RNA polymerase II transcription subunit 22 [Drosophila subpulchrella]XP_037708576.1 mediator of RNA polymerase II transcription subunit 22 [Drosophila subpulchrella]